MLNAHRHRRDCVPGQGTRRIAAALTAAGFALMLPYTATQAQTDAQKKAKATETAARALMAKYAGD